jgi:hypothetical protein
MRSDAKRIDPVAIRSLKRRGVKEMLTRNALRLHLLTFTALLLVFAGPASAADDGRIEPVSVLEDTSVRLAAGWINGVFGAVADSTRALGDTCARLAAAQDAETPFYEQHWLARRTTQGYTTGLQTWPGDRQAPPAFQAPYPAFYSFNGEALSNRVLRRLNLFERLVPTFRTAYESFPFSWVYLTTADDALMIYPYLPIDEAVNDDKPTKTLYYRSANFEDRAVGWTPPYLDLVGAGMMITASYPVYVGETLLGVMSRDITLKQLTNHVLSHLSDIEDGRALIVDGKGLAIDASAPGLAAEIDRVNSKAGAAVLYYRTEDGLRTIDAKDAVVSQHASVDALVEQVLAKADSGDDPVRLDAGGRRVLAARIESTGWLVVLILARDAA